MCDSCVRIHPKAIDYSAVASGSGVFRVVPPQMTLSFAIVRDTSTRDAWDLHMNGAELVGRGELSLRDGNAIANAVETSTEALHASFRLDFAVDVESADFVVLSTSDCLQIVFTLTL